MKDITMDNPVEQYGSDISAVSGKFLVEFLNSNQDFQDMIIYYKKVSKTLSDDDVSFTANFIRTIANG